MECTPVFRNGICYTYAGFIGPGHGAEAHSRTSSAIRSLLGLVPPVARIIRDGQEEEILIEELQVGDMVRVKPGENSPVDGTITEGVAVIDESMITGEPIPSTNRK